MSLSSPVGCEGDVDCGCGCADRGWGGADVWPAERAPGLWVESSGHGARSADPSGDLEAWPVGGAPRNWDDWPDFSFSDERPNPLTGWEYVWPTEGVAATLSMRPHLLTPPAGWQDHSDCEDELSGDEEECSVWVTPRTQAEFWDLPAGETEGALEIIGATTEETGLLRKAWAVLVDSTDFVRWAACWYTGRSEAGDCMIRHIEGRSVNRTVIEVVDDYFLDDSGTEVEGVMMSAEEDWGIVNDLINSLIGGWGFDIAPEGRITVYRGNYDWSRSVEIWSGATQADRYCVALHIAAALLHELTHVCMSGSDYPLGECKESYLTGGVFLYALHHAWPGVVESGCCGVFWEDSDEGATIFGCSETRRPTYSSCPDFVDAEGSEDGDSGWVTPHRDEDDSGPTDDKGLAERPEWRYR